MGILNAEIARLENGRIVAPGAQTALRWELSELTSSDGHQITAGFSASVIAPEAAADRRLLAQTLLNRASSVTAADAAAHLAPSINSAARKFIQSADAQTILSERGKQKLKEILLAAARSVAFTCGLAIISPVDLELESSTLTAQQEQSRRATAQSERMGRAAEMFKKFQELRAAAPDMPVEQVLQQLAGADPADQTDMLRCLLLGAAPQAAAQSLWVVAGSNLIKIEKDAQPRVLTPSAAAGPFRSVQRSPLQGKTVLLLGAQSGLLVVDPQSPDQASIYADAPIDSQLGFNAAGIAGGMIWATHGQAGLVGWKLDAPQTPAIAIRPGGLAKSPRNLFACDENRLVFSSESHLLAATLDGAISEIHSASAPVLTIVPESARTFLVVYEDGLVERRKRNDASLVQSARRCSRVTAAGALPWLGGTRLILATEAGPVLCAGLDDQWVTQYVSNHGGLRLAAATADRVGAVSADRQRILLWPSWDGRQPSAEIHISAVVRHRIADVEFA